MPKCDQICETNVFNCSNRLKYFIQMCVNVKIASNVPCKFVQMLKRVQMCHANVQIGSFFKLPRKTCHKEIGINGPLKF